MKYTGQKILVLGLGRSGRAAVALLRAEGAQVAGYDANADAGADLEGIERLAELPGTDQMYADYDFVVASPGFPVTAHEKLVPEIDLAAAHFDGPIVGITGTNGKSTTTVLTGLMLAHSGLRTSVGGNLGHALCEVISPDADRLVAEVSSFQLEHARRFRAHVAVILNLAPDHLDRHRSLEAYAAAKERLVELQQPDDILVANLDDPWARAVAGRAKARLSGFSMRKRLEDGAFLQEDHLVLARGGETVLRVAVSELSRACRSPIANALASAAAADAAGASPEAIRRALVEFEGLPHRAQEVCVRGGAHYVNDSKATNPAAAAATLRSFDGPVIWILGGRNKGLDFDPLREAAANVRCAITFGEAADELALALVDAPEVARVDTLDEAVHEAADRATQGTIVLLSPACASFDQFDDFEARGNAFAELARALPDRPLQENPAC